MTTQQQITELKDVIFEMEDQIHWLGDYGMLIGVAFQARERDDARAGVVLVMDRIRQHERELSEMHGKATKLICQIASP